MGSRGRARSRYGILLWIGSGELCNQEAKGDQVKSLPARERGLKRDEV